MYSGSADSRRGQCALQGRASSLPNDDTFIALAAECLEPSKRNLFAAEQCPVQSSNAIPGSMGIVLIGELAAAPGLYLFP